MGISVSTTSGKILASVALVGTAAAVAGLGTYGAFTSTTTANAAVSTGTVQIALGSAANSPLNLPVTGLLPGDTVERLVDVTNTGTTDLGSVYLTTKEVGNADSALTSGKVPGLQMTIEKCSVPWTGDAAPYTCPRSGTRSVVRETSPIIGTANLGDLAVLKVRGTDHLKITANLHKETPNSSQGLESTVSFTFDATQRTEMYK
jgi:hypothetical protein